MGLVRQYPGADGVASGGDRVIYQGRVGTAGGPVVRVGMAPGINSLTYAMFAIASDVMNPQQPAAAIRQLRARLNLSQEQLAARLNVSYATINRWEAGKSKPQRAQPDAIEALASEHGEEEAFATDARPRSEERRVWKRGEE